MSTKSLRELAEKERRYWKEISTNEEAYDIWKECREDLAKASSDGETILSLLSRIEKLEKVAYLARKTQIHMDEPYGVWAEVNNELLAALNNLHSLPREEKQ